MTKLYIMKEFYNFCQQKTKKKIRQITGIDRNISINAASFQHIAYINTILQHI